MKHYLATTGISEIWDLEKKLLLLGHWCLTSENNKKVLKNKDYIVIPSPWKPAIKIKEAADYCHKVYEEILPQLSEGLNSIHQVSYSDRYWRVLLGPWLLHFIGVLYDRYKRIENTLVLFADFYTHVLPLDQCKTATIDTADFLSFKINEDYYNLKLFSLVAHYLCPNKNVETKVKAESETNNINHGFKKVISYPLKRIIKKILEFPDKTSIVLSDMYHLSYSDMFLFKWEAGFRAISFRDFNNIDVTLLKYNYSNQFRELLKLKGTSDRFQSFLYSVLPDAIPMCYMENYKLYRNSIKNANSAKIVGSAVGWYFNEVFKFYVAEVISKEAKPIDFQHGGGYGLSLAVPPETISLEKDIFYTWGWELNNNKTRFLPNPHLSRSKNTHSLKLDNILFVGTAMPVYHYRFQTNLFPEDMPKYFDDKKAFFQALKNEVKSKILYRPYYEYGWKEIETIEKILPKVKFLFDIRVVNYMKKVKLVVIDHPATSYLEALTINVPTILFWDHEVHLMRTEAAPYFDELRDAGILHDTPQSAAKLVNEIYSDSILWWRQPEVQKAKDEFCHQFARTSKNWRKKWVKSLRGFL